MEGIDLFVKIGFCQDLVSRQKEGRKKFRSLEVRGKLIALKNSVPYFRE